jgi:hypothetical protein
MGVTNIGIDRVRGVGRGASKHMAASPYDELCGACWRGRLAVTATGEIFPCVFSRFCPVGHVDHGLESALEGIPLHAFRQRMQQERAQDIVAECNPDGSCVPGTCTPRVVPPPPTPCRPEEVGCHPNHCNPSGCLPGQCTPETCTPPIHCRPDAK